MRKYLITGGLGFIGSNFINTLYKQLSQESGEFEIHCIDSQTYAASINNLTREVRKAREFHLHSVDIKSSSVLEIMKEHDFQYCAHFAAESHVDRSITNPLVFVETNVIGTANLLNSWKATQSTRFLHVSTDEVYGSLEFGEADEEHQLDPSSPYSASKAASDLLVLSYIRTFGLDALVTRCTNNFGLNQNNEKLIPKLVENCINGKPLTIYADGKNVREWIHVADHVEALITLLNAEKLNHNVYNIGSGNRKTNLEVLDAIKIVSKISEPMVEHTEDRPGHDLRYAVNSDRIRDEFGWEPIYDLQTGIQELVSNYRLTKTFETSPD